MTAVFEDGDGGVATSSIVIKIISPQENLIAEIDAIIAAIQSSSDADWRCPAINHKCAMIEKLEEVKGLVVAGNYAEAYDKLLHDVKPKLIGLKTDENEIPWSNGVFPNSWVTSPALQQAFKDLINPVLREIKSLAASTSVPPCHYGDYHHECHCYVPHHEGGQPSGSHNDGHAHGPNHENGNHCGSGNHPARHGCW